MTSTGEPKAQFRAKKCMGLVNSAFSNEDLSKLTGTIGIGEFEMEMNGVILIDTCCFIYTQSIAEGYISGRRSKNVLLLCWDYKIITITISKILIHCLFIHIQTHFTVLCS